MDIYVFIYLPGQTKAIPAGLLEYHPGDASTEASGSFRYGDRYRNRKEALPVDPVSLPLSGEISVCRTNKGLHGAFRDSVPDMWGRLVTAKQLKAPPESLNEGDFLLHSTGLRVGNLDFRPSLDAPEPEYAIPTQRDLEELIDAARRIRQDKPVDEDLLQLFLHGSSLGGARPKCVVQAQGSLWVAKFPDVDDRWNYARVEWATMCLAGKCGVVIPEMRIALTEMGDVLLSKRFDREPGQDGFARHGYLSALSALQLDESDSTRFCYLSLADTFRKHGIGGQGTLKQLFRRMVFNGFCRNTDDHPRNHGVLYKAGQGDLSPAFDIVPTPTRPGVGEDFSLSMNVGPLGRVTSLENFQGGAARFGLDSRKANQILVEMAEQVLDWKQIFTDCGVARDEIDRFRPSFDSVFLRETLKLGNK